MERVVVDDEGDVGDVGGEEGREAGGEGDIVVWCLRGGKVIGSGGGSVKDRMVGVELGSVSQRQC